jgi:hypothetical protein
MNFEATKPALAIVVALLSACGGGDPAPAPAPLPPGGLYVGYYQEDALTNPEDPTPGAFSLNLPAADAAFSGSMYFTYVGCQSSNVGAVGGTKSGTSLSGTWSGAVDGLPQSGTYSGTYDASALAYSGTFLNSGGKQFRDLSPCIQYTIAPKGTWEMFPVEAQVPSTFAVTVNGRTLSWPATSGAAFTLVYVLDAAIAQSTGNPVLWQAILTTATTVNIPSTVTLQPGRELVAVVGISDAQHQRNAFASKRFTP